MMPEDTACYNGYDYAGELGRFERLIASVSVLVNVLAWVVLMALARGHAHSQTQSKQIILSLALTQEQLLAPSQV